MRHLVRVGRPVPPLAPVELAQDAYGHRADDEERQALEDLEEQGLLFARGRRLLRGGSGCLFGQGAVHDEGGIQPHQEPEGGA